MTVVFFFVILFCDQAVKAYIRSSFQPGESLPVVPHVFHITYVLNPGAAFGIFANQRLFFIAAGVLLFCLAVYFYPRLRREGRWLRFSVASLLAGAAGNLIDRIASGLVVDFLDFRIWPVFNLADIAIVGGVIGMMLVILFPARFDADAERRRQHG